MFTLEHRITVGGVDYDGKIEYRYLPAEQEDPAEVVILGVWVGHPSSGKWVEVVLEHLDLDRVEEFVHTEHVHEGPD